MICLRRKLAIAILVMALAPCVRAQHDPDSQVRGPVRLVLPPVVYAVPGIEANLYFDNVILVLNRANYALEILCDKGIQLEERWTFTPKPQDVGEYRIGVVVRDEQNAVLARVATRLLVVPADRKATVSLLLVGDSLTDTRYSHYPQRLVELDAGDELLDLTLIGSRGLNDQPPEGPVRHEGYGGWTAEAFVTLHGPDSRRGINKRPDTGSPFMYDGEGGKPRLDFTRYCQDFNAGAGPDAILILLGANDVFRATDESIDDTIDKSLGFFDELIREFHRARPNTRIGIGMTPPPSHSQDGFRNYAGARHQTRWQYRRNQHRIIERMVDRYSGRATEGIELVPVYINLDTVRHFRTWTAPPTTHSSEKAVRVNDGVHPAREGHFQIADTIYSWLKAVASPADAR